MIERQWIINAIKQYEVNKCNYFSGDEVKISSKITKKKVIFYKETKEINIFGNIMSRQQCSLDLEEFIQDCQEKVPLVLKFVKKYQSDIARGYDYEWKMKFILDVYEKARKKQLREGRRLRKDG